MCDYNKFIMKTNKSFKNILDKYSDKKTFDEIIKKCEDNNIIEYVNKNKNKIEYILLCITHYICEELRNYDLLNTTLYNIFKLTDSYIDEPTLIQYIMLRGLSGEIKNVTSWFDILIEKGFNNFSEMKVHKFLNLNYRYYTYRDLFEIIYTDCDIKIHTKGSSKYFLTSHDFFNLIIDKYVKNNKKNEKYIDKINTNLLELLGKEKIDLHQYMYFMLNTKIYDEKYIYKYLLDYDFDKNEDEDDIKLILTKLDNKILDITYKNLTKFNQTGYLTLYVNLYNNKINKFKKITLDEIYNILVKSDDINEIFNEYFEKIDNEEPDIEHSYNICNIDDKVCIDILFNFIDYFCVENIRDNYIKFIFLEKIGIKIFNFYKNKILESKEKSDELFKKAILINNYDIIEILLENKYTMEPNDLLYCDETMLDVVSEYGYYLDDNLIKDYIIMYSLDINDFMDTYKDYTIYKNSDDEEIKQLISKFNSSNLEDLIKNEDVFGLYDYLSKMRPKLYIKYLISNKENIIINKILYDYIKLK